MRRPGWFLALPIVLAATGCGRIGVREEAPVPLPDRAPFERALTAYARGDLGSAESGVRDALAAVPGDLRAGLLGEMVRAEREGEHPVPPALVTPAPVRPSGMPELLAAVQSRNLRLREATWRVAEARARLREAHLSLSPELLLMTRFYPLGLLAGVTQSVYGGLVRRDGLMHEAEADLLSALADYAAARQAVLGEAADSALSLASVPAVGAALHEEALAAARYEALARTGAGRGAVLRDALLEAVAERATTEAAARALAAAEQDARAELNGLLDQPALTPLADVDEVWPVTPSATPEAALEVAHTRRLELNRAREAVLRAAGRRDADLSRLPDIDLRTTWGLSGADTERNIQEGFSVGAVMRVPALWIPMRRAAATRHTAVIEQARLRELQAFYDIDASVLEAQGAAAAAVADAAAEWRRADSAAERARLAQLRGDVFASDAARAQLRTSRAELLAARAWRRALEREFAAGRAELRVALATGAGADELRYERRGLRPPRASGAARGLWVWRSSAAFRQDAGLALVEFALRKGLTHLFVRTGGPALRDEAAGWHAFLARAHAAGLRVHALGGAPSWSTPAGLPRALGFVDAVAAFNREAPIDARFDGLHLDVEPHALPAWDDAAQQSGLLTGFMHLFDEVRARDRGRLGVHADVPSWFARRDHAGEPLLQSLARRVDGLVLMAYAARPERVEASLRAAADVLRDTGVAWWAGLSADPLHRCAGDDNAAFEARLRALAAAFAVDRQLHGVAVHDYTRLAALEHSYEPGTGNCAARPTGEAGVHPSNEESADGNPLQQAP
jgi:outer membrane protein TolC